MAQTNSQLVWANIQANFDNVFPGELAANMEHQIACIIGDEQPTQQEINYAIGKHNKIASGSSDFLGQQLTPFEQLCMEIGSSAS